MYAGDLTRQGLWEALKARRCYATTGQRIVLSVLADGHTMGEEYSTSRPPTLSIHVVGTDPLASVELRDGNRLLYSHLPTDFGPPSLDQLLVRWTGACRRSRGRQTVWDGHLCLDRGTITHAETYAFESSGLEDELVEVTDTNVVWRSVTSGDVDGLLLSLDAPQNARVTFSSAPATFSFRLSDLADGPLVVDAGGVGQQVTVSRATDKKGPCIAQFEFRDHGVAAGSHAYWVRVVQADDGRAWSSPIFVNYDMAALAVRNQPTNQASQQT